MSPADEDLPLPLEAAVAEMQAATDRIYPPENTCVCGTTANPEPAPEGQRYWCSLCPDGRGPG